MLNFPDISLEIEGFQEFLGHRSVTGSQHRRASFGHPTHPAHPPIRFPDISLRDEGFEISTPPTQPILEQSEARVATAKRGPPIRYNVRFGVRTVATAAIGLQPFASSAPAQLFFV